MYIGKSFTNKRNRCPTSSARRITNINVAGIKGSQKNDSFSCRINLKRKTDSQMNMALTKRVKIQLTPVNLDSQIKCDSVVTARKHLDSKRISRSSVSGQHRSMNKKKKLISFKEYKKSLNKNVTSVIHSSGEKLNIPSAINKTIHVSI